MGSDTPIYHLSLLFSWEICTSDGSSMQSCKHSNLAHFLNISHMKLLSIHRHFTVYFWRPNCYFFHSNTKSAFAPEVTKSPVLTVESLPCRGSREHELMCTSEAAWIRQNTIRHLSNVVESQPELYQSKLKTVLYVFTGHNCTKVPLTVATTKTSLCHSLYLAMDSSWKTLWCCQ